MVIIGQRIFPRSEFDVLLGKRLARARGLVRMTQEEAAKRIGVRSDTLAKWEMGVRRPGLEKLRKLARIYGVDGVFLMGDS